MSIFGVYSVVKACLAASTPDWLRETIGVRNDVIDSVVGLNLDLKMNFRSRNRISGAIGISCAIKKVSFYSFFFLPMFVAVFARLYVALMDISCQPRVLPWLELLINIGNGVSTRLTFFCRLEKGRLLLRMIW